MSVAGSQKEIPGAGGTAKWQSRGGLKTSERKHIGLVDLPKNNDYCNVPLSIFALDCP